MSFLKKWIYFILYIFQFHHIFRYINRKKIIVLAYHGITKDNGDIKLWGQLEFRRFKKQILYLKRYHNVVSIHQLADYLQGSGSLPNNSVVITFDDGYFNNYEVAYPLLSKYELPATIFITTNFIDSQGLLWFDQVIVALHTYQGTLNIPHLNLRIVMSEINRAEMIELIIQTMKTLEASQIQEILQYLRGLTELPPRDEELIKMLRPMNWEQIKELGNSPLITLGAHTVDHQILTRCPVEIAKDQILRSKETLESVLKQPVRFFAYPNGKREDFNEATKELVRSADFHLSCSTIRRTVNLDEDPYEVGRFCIGNDWTSSPILFSLILSGFTEYLWRWSSKLRSLNLRDRLSS